MFGRAGRGRIARSRHQRAAAHAAAQDGRAHRRPTAPADRPRGAEGRRRPAVGVRAARALPRVAPDAPRGVPRPGVRVADHRSPRRARRGAGPGAQHRRRGALRRLHPRAPGHHAGRRLPGAHPHRAAGRRDARARAHRGRRRAPACRPGGARRGQRRPPAGDPHPHRLPRAAGGAHRQPDPARADRHDPAHHRPGELGLGRRERGYVRSRPRGSASGYGLTTASSTSSRTGPRPGPRSCGASTSPRPATTCCAPTSRPCST